MRQVGSIMVFDSKIVSSDIQGSQVLATDNDEGLPVGFWKLSKNMEECFLSFLNILVDAIYGLLTMSINELKLLNTMLRFLHMPGSILYRYLVKEEDEE